MATPEQSDKEQVITELIRTGDPVAMELHMAAHGVHEDLSAAVAARLQDEDRSTPTY